MIDFEQAKLLAMDYINNFENSENPNTIIEESTIFKPYGWIFIYDSEEFIRTENPSCMLLGNVPFLVDKQGQIRTAGLGTAYDLKYHTEAFDRMYI